MDELEFRKRIEADPHTMDQEILDAASANPGLQRILDQTRFLENRISDEVAATAAPAGLRERLLAIPQTDIAPESKQAELSNSNASQPWYRNFALAASLVIAIGASATFFVERGPDARELAFANQVIEHIYHEMSQIDAINAGTLLREFTMPTVNQVMANSGTQIRNADFLLQMPVRYANPCFIITASSSSHLILQSEAGAINVITINNEPVSQEFLIGDERFSGIVVPLAAGNLIIIGEKEQELGNYRDLFADNLEWVI